MRPPATGSTRRPTTRARRRPRPTGCTRKASTRSRSAPPRTGSSGSGSRRKERTGVRRPGTGAPDPGMLPADQRGEALPTRPQGFLGRFVSHPFTRPAAVDNLASYAITDLPAPEAGLRHQLHLDAEMLRLVRLHAPSSCGGRVKPCKADACIAPRMTRLKPAWSLAARRAERAATETRYQNVP